MIPAGPHPREDERLALLDRCSVLDTSAEPEFDALVELAAWTARVPVAAISLVDAHRQWFKAKRGIDVSETPRSLAYCAHTILDAEPLVVSNTDHDARFRQVPVVEDVARVGFYAGIPLRVGPDRLPVGTLCVADTEPRLLEPDVLGMLVKLARQAELLLEIRLRHNELEQRARTARLSEERLQAILGAMDEGLVVQRRDGMIIECNPSAERILGLSADQLMGRTSTDPRWRAVRADGTPFPGIDHPPMEVMRTGRPVRGVLMGVGTGDGDQRWILINAQPASLSTDGLPATVVVSFSDVTELRNEAFARHKAEEEIELFFSLSLELLCIGTFEGRFLRVNPAWTTTLGHLEAELFATPVHDFVHDEDRELVAAELSNLASGGRTVDFECRVRHRDGSYLRLSWVAVGVPERGLVLAVARDVTGRRERELELIRAKDAAEAAGRAKSEFLATVSHELRTPMNGVIGLTDILFDTPLDDRQREILDSIRQSGRALLTILNDILDWSRMQAGKLELECGPTDPVLAVREVVTLLAPQASGLGLPIDLVVRGDAPPIVHADAGRLRQVLFNLVGNAIKFTHRGRITVRIAADDADATRCLIAVQDTGIGIAAEHLPDLFQRFSQVDSSATRRHGGTGLGLAISRHLAEAMGATISVQTTVGVGSTFTLSLRLGTKSSSARVEPDPGPDVPSIRPLKLLLAEDNLVNQRVAHAILTRDGHTLEIASNGIEALVAFRRSSFDCVLMDLRMPELDGLDTTRAIRTFETESGRRRTPVIALTASAMREEADACFAAGMDDVVAKPVTGPALRHALARVASSFPQPARGVR